MWDYSLRLEPKWLRGSAAVFVPPLSRGPESGYRPGRQPDGPSASYMCRGAVPRPAHSPHMSSRVNMDVEDILVSRRLRSAALDRRVGSCCRECCWAAPWTKDAQSAPVEQPHEQGGGARGWGSGRCPPSLAPMFAPELKSEIASRSGRAQPIRLATPTRQRKIRCPAGGGGATKGDVPCLRWPRGGTQTSAPQGPRCLRPGGPVTPTEELAGSPK